MYSNLKTQYFDWCLRFEVEITQNKSCAIGLTSLGNCAPCIHYMVITVSLMITFTLFSIALVPSSNDVGSTKKKRQNISTNCCIFIVLSMLWDDKAGCKIELKVPQGNSSFLHSHIELGTFLSA